MARLVSPALDQLSSLRTPLTKGEKKVLDIFLKKLSEKWEIYIQPHLNGLRPDFVLLNPNVGIGIFEVKDWNLDAMPYRVEYDQHQLPQLWATNHQGIDFRQENPISKISLYKDEIINLYCPLIDIKSIQDSRNLAVITAGVIMTEASQHQIETLFNPFRKQNGMFGKSASYYPLAGRETLETEDILAIFPGAKWNSSQYMTAELAKDLRSWLVEPDFAHTQRQPLELNKEQKNLINSRTKTGYRRIKGSAGSGKSLVLAGRAAQLSSENKDVLVVSFNITLWHYLRDLAVRHHIPNTKINTVTWLHFHQWCKRVCYQAGDEYIKAYQQLWKKLNGIEKSSDLYEEILQQILEHDLPDLVNQVIDEKFDTVTTYDAILVDEGQDYNPKWWNLLRKICREDGEMILLADQTQDLYDRASYWTDESMKGLDTGFTGLWSTLDFCYRTPNVLIPYLQKFAKTFLPTTTINLPEQDQEELNIFPVKMRWLQVNNGDSIDIFTQEILKMPLWTNPDQLSFSDTVFLVQDHKTGLKCVNILENKNIKVAHVFGENHQQQKKRKMGFFMGDAKVKGATIHSFKGWESCCVVINISKADSETELAAIYVAISRLKRRDKGSYITVVCSTPQLEEFGSTWENFEILN